MWSVIIDSHMSKVSLVGYLVLLLIVVAPAHANSQTIQGIQEQINSRNTEILRLEEDIKAYQYEIQSLSTKAKSLSSTVQELELTRKKLEADIKITEGKILQKNLELKMLSGEISKTESSIVDNIKYIETSIKKIAEANNGARELASLLSGQSLTLFSNTVNELIILESSLRDRISSLRKEKQTLIVNKSAVERARSELLRLDEQLSSQKVIIQSTINEQKKLLSDTKNSESAYSRILREKQSLMAAFEQEILKLESELKLAVDRSKLPKSGQNVFIWPLNNVRITQYFGNTDFASRNAQLYSGRGHNGIDLGTMVGTPVKAALSGTIVGQGDTDIYPRCYSLGKWVLIRHDNGLSTLYAHLSLIAVQTGSRVTTGDLIAYTGNTGYSTGPHLHFGVYASSGIEIRRFTTSTSCSGATLPIASFEAYLNPLAYLPAIN